MSAVRSTLTMTALVLAGVTLLGAAPRARESAATVADAKYVAVLFNKRALPTEENIPSTKGYHHYLKVDEAVLDMRANGRFIASFRYYHDLVKDGATVPKLRVLRETHRGTYTVRGTSVTFAPELGKKSKLPRPVIGVLEGNRMKVDYEVDDGAGPRMLRVELKKQDNWYLQAK